MPNAFGQDQKPNLFVPFHLQGSISQECDLSQTSIKGSFWSYSLLKKKEEKKKQPIFKIFFQRQSHYCVLMFQ